MNAERDEASEYFQCYRCGAGCIHVVCGPVMVRLTPPQFGELAEAVKGLAAQLESEQLLRSRIC